MNRDAFAEYQRLTTRAFQDPGLSKLERATLLKNAATLATPVPCRGQACESDPQACRSRHTALSQWDRRDCLQRLWAHSNACKLEAVAAIDAGSEGLRMALPRWLEAEASAAAAASLDPAPPRLRHWHYLAYWRCLTAGRVALNDADFPEARKVFAEGQQFARDLGPALHAFYGPKELAAEDICIDAVASVKARNFPQAAELFDKWLNLFPERRGSYDLRFDSILASHLACVIIAKALKGEDTSEPLATLNRHLRSTNVPLPTWALYRRVEKIAAAAHLARSAVRSLVDEDDTLWRLFLPHAQLAETEKTAGQARTLMLPRFLDLSGLSPDCGNWFGVLEQSFENALRVLVDYERFRHDVPLDDERHLPALTPLPAVSDDMRSGELLRVLRRYLERRDQKLLPACDRASSLLTQLRGTMRFPEALAIYQATLECFRFPHTALVDDVTSKVIDGRVSKSRTGYVVTLRRLWNREPRILRLETLEPLAQGRYYYLRPTWNTKLGAQYPLDRGGRAGIARAARWVDAFWRGVFMPHTVDSARFIEWTLQFPASERRFALTLFDALDFYDVERVRNEWTNAYQQLPPGARQDVAFVGLGHAAKSGRSQVYYFRQGIERLPEYEVLYRGREKIVFPDLSVLAANAGNRARYQTYVFIDDFVGTGGQAADFLKWYFRRVEFGFLRNANVFLLVLAGFEAALRDVETVLRSEVDSHRTVGVAAARGLKEEARAFASTNPIWRDAAEAVRAQEWAETLGKELLLTDPTRDGEGRPLYDPTRDALGWHGCQALISFSHNIPSDTLPIFWSRGSRRGKPWVPLQRRSD